MFKLALLTGASSGLGEALARRLALEKIPLIISGRNRKRLEALAYELRSLVPVEIVVCDLGLQRGDLIQIIRTRAPDLFINNAGYTFYGNALSDSLSIQREILEVNAAAPIELCLEAAKALFDRQERGIILNVSSLAGELVYPTMASYSAAKACLTSFSKSFHAEMHPYGIEILVSIPGQIQTEFATRASQSHKSYSWAMTKKYAVERIWRQILQRKPVDRFNPFYAAMATLTQYLPAAWVFKWIKREKNCSK